MDIFTQQIRKLPTELQYNILKYSYKVQNKSLLQDIRSFHETNITLTKMYENAFKYGYNPETYKDWLSNDIVSFMNTDQATMYGYTEEHYKMWRRMLYLTRKNNKFIYNNTLCMKTNAIGEFRTRLGVLIPEERMALKDYCVNIL